MNATPFQGAWKIATVMGIPIRLHYSWFIIFGLITWSLSTYYFPEVAPDLPLISYWLKGTLAAVLLFASVAFHELAHSYVAQRYRMTIVSITLFIFGGVAQMKGEPPHPRAEFRIALSGPLSSFFLALVFFLLSLSMEGTTQALFAYLARLNLILGVFNLIPGFPMDGGRVLRSILWGREKDYFSATQKASSVGKKIGLFFIFFGLFSFFIGFPGGLWLLLIGWFVYTAAQSSYQQATLQEVLSGVKVKDGFFGRTYMKTKTRFKTEEESRRPPSKKAGDRAGEFQAKPRGESRRGRGSELQRQVVEIQELNGALREAREELESLRKKYTELEEPVRQRTQKMGALTQELKNEINERKQREKELEKARDSHMQERRRLEAIPDTVPSGVVIIEKPKGRIAYVNRRGLQLLGKESVKGLVMALHSSRLKLLTVGGETYPSEELPASRALLGGETVRGEELLIEHPDGHRITVLASASPLRNESGEITGAVGVFHDISRRKKAEKEIMDLNQDLRRRTLELEAANRELEAFTASVAHDLRTPLIVMGSYSQRLLKKYADRLDAGGQEYVKQLLATIRKMEEIIDDLLRISYVAHMEISYNLGNLSLLAKSVAQELQKMEPDRQAEFIIAEDLLAEGDLQLLRITLENLLQNAWKFSRYRPQAKIEFGAIQAAIPRSFSYGIMGAVSTWPMRKGSSTPSPACTNLKISRAPESDWRR